MDQLEIWFELDHPNILMFKGIVKEDSFICPSLVFDWMENGSLQQYTKEKQGWDKSQLVRRSSCSIYDYSLDFIFV